MVGKDACHHRLTNWDGADADAGVVSALSGDFSFLTGPGDCVSWRQDGRGRLHSEPHNNVLTGGDSAQNAARMIGSERGVSVLHAHFIGVLISRERRGAKASADLDTLYGVDAHHRGREVRVEFAIEGRAPAYGNAAGNNLNDGTDGRSSLPDLVQQLGPARSRDRVWTKERITIAFVPIPVAAVDRI
jgi:hypothetical protein